MMRALSLVVLLSLAACSGESPGPQPSDAAGSADSIASTDATVVTFGDVSLVCPSPDVAAGSQWSPHVCDRGASLMPRFVSVETCARDAGVLREVSGLMFTASHPFAARCPGVVLVTAAAVVEAYRNAR